MPDQKYRWPRVYLVLQHFCELTACDRWAVTRHDQFTGARQQRVTEAVLYPNRQAESTQEDALLVFDRNPRDSQRTAPNHKKEGTHSRIKNGDSRHSFSRADAAVNKKEAIRWHLHAYERPTVSLQDHHEASVIRAYYGLLRDSLG